MGRRKKKNKVLTAYQICDKLREMLSSSPKATVTNVSVELGIWGDWEITVDGDIPPSVLVSSILFSLPISGKKIVRYNNKILDDINDIVIS